MEVSVLIVIGLCLLAALNGLAQPLSELPAGYQLQVFEDCGLPTRQPHVTQSYGMHTFSEASVAGTLTERSIAFDFKRLELTFEGLHPVLPYVLAITWTTERGNPRMQSLFVDDIPLLESYSVPDGQAERLLFNVPEQALADGKLVIATTLVSGHNAVMSAVELWAPTESPPALYLEAAGSAVGRLSGQVSGLDWQGLAGAEVTVTSGGKELANATTGPEGLFSFGTNQWAIEIEAMLTVTARKEGLEESVEIEASSLVMPEPVFRPMAEERLSLEGEWLAQPEPQGDWQHGATEGWKAYQVPGQLLQQGFEFDPKLPVGLVKWFEAPADWQGKRVFVRFEAVHGGAEYWLNGVKLGESSRIATPVDFELTEALRFDAPNGLAVSLVMDTISEQLSFMSGYAFHPLAGLPRAVTLFALPEAHIERLHHTTLLDGEYRDAVLQVVCELDEGKQAGQDFSLEVELQAPDGSLVPLPTKAFPIEWGRIKLNLLVEDPLKWSAEKPWLYTLKVKLLRGDKKIETQTQRVGFRSVEVKGERLLVNGAPVKLAGVNRHEIDPLTGRAATAKWAELDARLFKAAAVNYVRTSHYPPTKEWLEACDELGLYVEVEAPFCWTRRSEQDDPAAEALFLDPTSAMVEFYRDHPSCILWSLGNESGYTSDGPNELPPNYRTSLRLVRRADTSRPVVFNNEWGYDGGRSDLLDLHYPLIPYMEYKPVVEDGKRPVLMGEFFPIMSCHYKTQLAVDPGVRADLTVGMNNPDNHWCEVIREPRLAGGAIWAAIDDDFFLPDGRRVGYGEWGIQDVWRRVMPDAWLVKSVYTPVWIAPRQVDFEPGQQEVILPIENRYSFTDLSELACKWEVAGKSGTLKLSLPPLSQGELTVPLPEGVEPGALLVLSFTDQEGRPRYRARSETWGRAPCPAQRGQCQARRNLPRRRTTYTVTGAGFSFSLDKLPERLQRGQVARLRTFPALHLSRREDRGIFWPTALEYKELPDRASRVVEGIEAKQTPEGLLLTVRDRYEDFAGQVDWLLDKSGRCKVSFDYEYMGEPLNTREVGIRLVLKPDCQRLSWQRQSEWDVYPEGDLFRAEGQASAHRRGT